MSIGSTIKSLRRSKNLTQEDLAEYLGISSKAISQWECDRTTPDISQLPALCNFFDITSDKLLGIDIIQKTTERDRLLDEGSRLAKNGYKKEAFEIFHKAIRQFPGDYIVMAYIIEWSCYSDYNEKLKEECKHYCNLILENCNDDFIRHSATYYLCDSYAENGDMEKAMEMAFKMPIMCQSREFMLAKIYNGTEGIKYKQDLTFDLVQFLSRRISCNYKLDSGKYLYSEDEIAALRDKIVAFLALMFENGDYGFYEGLLSETHCDQALFYASQKDKSLAFYHLEKATDHAIRFMEFMQKDQYIHSSLLFREMTENSIGVSFSDSDNDAMKILNCLDRQEFEFVKDHPVIQRLKERLIPYAGRNEY